MIYFQTNTNCTRATFLVTWQTTCHAVGCWIQKVKWCLPLGNNSPVSLLKFHLIISLFPLKKTFLLNEISIDLTGSNKTSFYGVLGWIQCNQWSFSNISLSYEEVVGVVTALFKWTFHVIDGLGFCWAQRTSLGVTSIVFRTLFFLPA